MHSQVKLKQFSCIAENDLFLTFEECRQLLTVKQGQISLHGFRSHAGHMMEKRCRNRLSNLHHPIQSPKVVVFGDYQCSHDRSVEVVHSGHGQAGFTATHRKLLRLRFFH